VSNIARGTATPGQQRLLMFGLNLIALVLWGLHLYGRTLPPTPTAIPQPASAEAAWWGVWPITYAPAWVVTLMSLCLISVMLWGWAQTISHWPWTMNHWQFRQRLTPRGPLSLFATLCAISIVLIVAFFAFPIVHTRWGDAYILANAISWPDPALRLTHSWQAPLDVFLHSRLWLWLHEDMGWDDAAPVYRLLSPLAGVLYLEVVLALSRDDRLAPGWLTYGMLTSLGLLQLFFGYVENYSFAAAGVLAYLWLGMGALRGDQPLWLAALILAITNATHPSTVVLAPSLLYCGWRVARRSTNTSAPSWRSTTMQIALPMVCVAGGTILLMEMGGHGIAALLTSDRPGGSDARPFVPLFATSTRWEHYTLFSWLHLRDFLNQQLLVAPVVLPSFLLLGPFWLHGRRTRQRSCNPLHTRYSTRNFLFIATVSYLLFTWVWNPDYGGQRDWDLFSLAALPTTLLLIALLPCVLPCRRYLLAGARPLILVQAFHTTIWIYQNTLPWEWP